MKEGHRTVKAENSCIMNHWGEETLREEKALREGKNLNEQCVRTTNEIWGTYV